MIHDWCWLGTARDDGALASLLEVPPRRTFDADIARLLIRTVTSKRLPVTPLAVRAHEDACA